MEVMEVGKYPEWIADKISDRKYHVRFVVTTAERTKPIPFMRIGFVLSIIL